MKEKGLDCMTELEQVITDAMALSTFNKQCIVWMISAFVDPQTERQAAFRRWIDTENPDKETVNQTVNEWAQADGWAKERN